MSHASKAWKLDFVLLAAIWGASFLFMRMGALELGVMATAGLRVGIASIFLLPLLLARGLGPVLRNHWKQVLVVGILNSVIPIACFSYALLSITTGLTSILNATTPLFGAVIAWLWLKDKPNGLRTLGLTIGFVGVALLAWDKASFKPDASGASSGWAVLAFCQFHQTPPEPRALIGIGYRQPIGCDGGVAAAKLVVLARPRSINARLAVSHRPGRVVLWCGLHCVFSAD